MKDECSKRVETVCEQNSSTALGLQNSTNLSEDKGALQYTRCHLKAKLLFYQNDCLVLNLWDFLQKLVDVKKEI